MLGGYPCRRSKAMLSILSQPVRIGARDSLGTANQRRTLAAAHGGAIFVTPSALTSNRRLGVWCSPVARLLRQRGRSASRGPHFSTTKRGLRTGRPIGVSSTIPQVHSPETEPP